MDITWIIELKIKQISLLIILKIINCLIQNNYFEWFIVQKLLVGSNFESNSHFFFGINKKRFEILCEIYSNLKLSVCATNVFGFFSLKFGEWQEHLLKRCLTDWIILNMECLFCTLHQTKHCRPFQCICRWNIVCQQSLVLFPEKNQTVLVFRLFIDGKWTVCPWYNLW